jgi:hypothetical protein
MIGLLLVVGIALAVSTLGSVLEAVRPGFVVFMAPRVRCLVGNAMAGTVSGVYARGWTRMGPRGR